jgi:hypothetical protein
LLLVFLYVWFGWKCFTFNFTLLAYLIDLKKISI